MGNLKGVIQCRRCDTRVEVYGDAGSDFTFTLEHRNKIAHELHIEPMMRDREAEAGEAQAHNPKAPGQEG